MAHKRREILLSDFDEDFTRSEPARKEECAGSADSPHDLRSSTPCAAGTDLAALPEILTVEDVAQIAHVSVSTARRQIRSGSCGPWTRMGRRLVVRREAFLEAIRAREEMRRGQVQAKKNGERFRDLLFGNGKDD